MKSFTDKQRAFVEEYLIDFNASQAALRAGYSPRTARSQGQRLLTNVDIRDALEDAQKVRTKRTCVTQDYVVYMLVEVVETCMGNRAVFDKDGNEIGKSAYQPGPAIRALEILGRHTGGFSGKDEQPSEIVVNVVTGVPGPPGSELDD